MIDHGRHITGQGVQANGSRSPGAGAVISPTGAVELPRSRVYTALERALERGTTQAINDNDGADDRLSETN